MMKIRTSMIALVLLFVLLPVWALAAQSIDQSRAVSLTIDFAHEEKAIVGARFRIYRIADIDAAGNPTLVSPFNRYPVDLNVQSESQLNTLASTLEGYILRDGIAPTDSGEINQKGMLRFPNQASTLRQGLYLILGDRYTLDGNTYEIQPVAVSLPALSAEDDSWVYQGMLYPKYDVMPDAGDREPIRRKVLKVWKDNDYELLRPQTIVVRLLRNGTVYDTVELNAQTNWRHTWENLDPNDRWLVVEDEIENYAVETTREGITYVLTNTFNAPDVTPPPTPKPTAGPSDLPQTGQVWWPVPVLITGGLLLVVIGLLRYRSNGYEE